MNVGDILSPEGVILDLRVPDKRRLIEELARRSSELAGVRQDALFEMLIARENLGSTGMGGGIAIPHARLASSTRPVGMLARLRPHLDFEAIDGQRVDLVFLLLLPDRSQGEHLNALACVARKLRDEGVRAALRKAHGVEHAYAVLTD